MNIVPNWFAPIITFWLILVVWSVFNATTLFYVSKNTNFILMVFIIVIEIIALFWMVMASSMDPGYLPKRNFVKIGSTYAEQQALPFFSHYLFSKGHSVKLKYWCTWEHYRPPRWTHWAICDWCIERIDHHWPWLGTCIGKRNYKYFFIFINLLSFLIIAWIVLSFCEIYMRVTKHTQNGSNFESALSASLKTSPFPIIYIVLAIISSLFVIVLCAYHHRLAWLSVTTNEHMKGTFDDFNYNPYK